KAFILGNEIKLVMLDTLSMFWAITDENDNAQVLARIKPWLALAVEADICVLLIHHERKAGGEGGRAARGGSSLVGAVQQSLSLDYERGAGPRSRRRILRSVGRYDETPRELLIELSPQDNTYRSLGDPLSTRERILEFLPVEGPGRTVRETAEQTNISQSRVNAVMKELSEDKKVVFDVGEGKGGLRRYRRIDEPDNGEVL